MIQSIISSHDLYTFACRKDITTLFVYFFKRGFSEHLYTQMLMEIELLISNIEDPGHVGTYVQGLFMNNSNSLS